MHSQARGSLFVSYPSLNTSINERNRIHAHHQIEILSDECEAIFSSNEYIDKHMEILSLNNESGLSIRRLLALQITIVKI